MNNSTRKGVSVILVEFFFHIHRWELALLWCWNKTCSLFVIKLYTLIIRSRLCWRHNLATSLGCSAVQISQRKIRHKLFNQDKYMEYFLNQRLPRTSPRWIQRWAGLKRRCLGQVLTGLGRWCWRHVDFRLFSHGRKHVKISYPACSVTYGSAWCIKYFLPCAYVLVPN